MWWKYSILGHDICYVYCYEPRTNDNRKYGIGITGDKHIENGHLQ